MSDTHAFIVNLDKIITANDYPAVVRLAAAQVKLNGYMHVGDFMQGLHKSDLELLLSMCDAISPDFDGSPQETHEAAGVLVALTTVLVVGEGTTEVTIEGGGEHLASMATFLGLEGLRRKGLVDVAYASMSFSDPDAEIARLRKQPDA